MARVAAMSITQGELDASVAQYKDQQERAGVKIAPSEMADFRRSVLEQIVRQRLLLAEARRQGIAVTDEEAIRFIQSQPVFAPGGKPDPSRWAAFASDPTRLRAALADAKGLLASQKLYQRLQKRWSPEAAEVDRRLAALTDQAVIRVLAPRAEWFDSGEPLSPDSIRARYRGLTAGAGGPSRVSISLAVVPFAGAAGPDPSPAVLKATRARADSLLAALRAGASFDDVAAVLGGARDAGTWSTGQTAGVFYEDHALGEEALRATRGQVLSRPVRVPTGLALARVDAVAGARVPSLAQLADSLARQQQNAERLYRARTRLEGLRASHPEIFRGVCVDWRGALIDSAGTKPTNPGDGELRRYYDEHKAEFARLDEQGKGLSYAPFNDVRETVRQRVIQSTRGRAMQDKALRLQQAWASGRRDKEAEKGMRIWEMRSTPGENPPPGVTQALLDTLLRATPGAVGAFPEPSGIFVYTVTRRDTTCVGSTSELDRRALTAAMAQEQEVLEQEARALFDRHPERYRSGPVYHYQYVVIFPKPWEVKDIPPARVRAYYDAHPEQFGQPAETRVRHILFVVPPRTDSTAARALALKVLQEAKAGAAFDSLAKVYSQDPATKDQGGDTGWFKKGATAPEFEKLAFALEPGEVGGPVRTRFGYHLLQGVERHDEKINDYFVVQGAAGSAVAQEMADSATHDIALALLKRTRTSADIARYGAQNQFQLRGGEWAPGDGVTGEVTRDTLVRADIAAMKRPGPLLAPVPMGNNWGVVVIDSIGRPRTPTWETARARAVSDAISARRERGVRAVLATAQRELAAGVSWDSVASVWGGSLDTAHRRGEPVPAGLDARSVDSLLFGPRALAQGKWALVEGPNGPALVYFAGRERAGQAPTAGDRAALTEMIRERTAYEYFESLKKRFPVRIVRADLNRRLTPPPSP